VESRQLYQEVILDHNRKPRNYGRLATRTHHAEGLNPLCGDHLHLDLSVEGDQITQVGFEGQSCAICKASTSMMSTLVKGRSPAEADRLVDGFRALATGQATDAQRADLGRLRVFEGIKDLPSRVKCAVLPWHTLHAALHATETVSTEGDADPLAGTA
jgi:nitrogen fixation NifU-like protein